MTNVLIVTPMHNEAANVRALARSLASQSFKQFEWWAVDDGSNDGTADMLSLLSDEGVIRFVSKDNDGGLIGGSAYTSWRFGVQSALRAHRESPVTHVMKLDADVRLEPEYLELVMSSFEDGNVALVGGVISTAGMKEQKFHVPGPVKLYTLEAFDSLAELPSAIGFDVMDEVVVARRGMSVVVNTDAKFALARAIGASEGGLHGRFRNGRVCRWTGYDFPYFLLHCARYVARRPYVLGSAWMLVGYAMAGSGPYAPDLRLTHRNIQRAKLRDAARNPIDWYKRAYGKNSNTKNLRP
ncbi:glycosyltransferase family A protein [Pseudarthrobacter sp. fls2-241-R2A-127]|uniref:glycosyltransferase family A protein n=1 Tax=Pseudarthrobacter sp. fls2-241-R2A-127 TaxID=3040303 RepID=UPI002553C686|nr:glycosyltransferase family A protein [Pseudarthrobacter sp. fls2-241-R2A-127]